MHSAERALADTNKKISPGDKLAGYAQLNDELQAMVSGEPDLIANLANCAALLFQSLPEINWAGFYLWKGNELVLGPFQGKPACVRIAAGKGVCGAAAGSRRTLIVPDVHQFPGHIACDTASKSEIVVPMLFGGRLVGVLDIDSPLLDRFDQSDADGLETIVGSLLAATSIMQMTASND